jgi:hypothetical protein
MVLKWLAEHWPFVLIAVGGVLATVGGLAAAIRQTQFERELRLRTDEAIASITGGDSYCEVNASIAMDSGTQANQWDLMISNNGKYPVYDIQVSIEDITKRMAQMADEIKQYGHPTMSVLAGTTEVHQQGNMSPHTAVMSFARLTLPSGADKQRYRVTIHARNGVVAEELSFARIYGMWTQALQVSMNGKVVREAIPDSFPRGVNGEVQW